VNWRKSLADPKSSPGQIGLQKKYKKVEKNSNKYKKVEKIPKKIQKIEKHSKKIQKKLKKIPKNTKKLKKKSKQNFFWKSRTEMTKENVDA